MNRTFVILALLILTTVAAAAPPPAFEDALLDRMTGTWVLRGTIAGKQTTHDLVCEWVLGHQYVRIREISREKGAGGQPEYEAIVFIGWDEKAGRYACLWLDSTGGGGLAAQAIGQGQRKGDEIAFLFKGADGSIFHTTFVYAKDTDTWQWLMDGEANGKLEPFARVRLTKK
jgi:hypothetical protein